MLPHMIKVSADLAKLKTLRWEVILDYLSGPTVIPQVLYRGREESQGQRERVEEVTLLTLKMETVSSG